MKIKKSSDPTSMGAGQIWKMLLLEIQPKQSMVLHNYIQHYERTTNIQLNNHSLAGDWIKFFNNSNTNAYINGFWKITKVDNNNFKLDEYKANSSVVQLVLGEMYMKIR